MALLAFLGAGYTDKQGPYTENVRRGLYYLRAIGTPSLSGLDWQQGSMYGHGIASMALGEALTLAEAENPSEHELYSLVELGTNFTCNAQHTTGSWGYFPRSPGDTTVTGWQIQSLIAAKRNGIVLQSNTLSAARRFLLSTTSEGQYAFGYKGPPAERTTTAVGLTMMLYLDQPVGYTPFDVAMDQLAERGPMFENVYHDYYAALALHHCQHPGRHQWLGKLYQHLVATQATTGHESGSWHFDDRWGNVAGRLYTTAMCALTLQVNYRYQPRYGETEFPLDVSVSP